MDVGTKKEPGRELGKAEVNQVGGGYIVPDEIPDENPGEGGPTGVPVEYANGG